MTDLQTKQFLKIMEKISRSLALLLEETKRQNELTTRMIIAAESMDADDDIPEDEDVEDDYDAVFGDHEEDAPVPDDISEGEE